MNKSILFKLAHILTKATKLPSDNYQVAFGACLKHLKSIRKIEGTEKQLAWASKILSVAANGFAEAVNFALTQIDQWEKYAGRTLEKARNPLAETIFIRMTNFVSYDIDQLFAICKKHNYNGIFKEMKRSKDIWFKRATKANNKKAA